MNIDKNELKHKEIYDKIKPLNLIKNKLKQIFEKRGYKTIEPPLYLNSKNKDINHRIEVYDIISSYLNNAKVLSKNCLEIPKISDIKYIIDKNIILEKQIGSPSVMGSIFLSHYKNDINNKFATKFSNPLYSDNITEYKILK